MLAKRLHMSTSTLHRYCNGDAVPTEYAPVERLARLCKARPEELVELHRKWVLADVTRGRKGAPSQGAGPAGGAASVDAPAPAGEPAEDTAVREKEADGGPVAGQPTAGQPVAGQPEAERPGAEIPGAGTRKIEIPGSGVPGSGVPGSGVPGASVPGASVPGASALGSGVPGAGVPGASALGSGVPGASALGSGVPGASAL
ncbi:helix-turn-helix domain-containing protein, partial [Streptomyces sp. NPDC005009]